MAFSSHCAFFRVPMRLTGEVEKIESQKLPNMWGFIHSKDSQLTLLWTRVSQQKA